MYKDEARSRVLKAKNGADGADAPSSPKGTGEASASRVLGSQSVAEVPSVQAATAAKSRLATL